MAFALISYPDINKENYQLIDNYRKTNDEWLYGIIKPHFSFVFPVFDFSGEDFINEIIQLTEDSKRFDFVIRCCTINKDSFSDYYHALLVPDEGYSKIVKLHDKLYSKKLKDNLRLDIDFIPHMGIGTSKDKFKCKQMVDEWNGKEFEIKGIISTLTIVEYKDDIITNLRDIILK